MRIIPGKTKVQIELFKGVTLADLLIGLIGVILIVFIIVSSLPFKLALVLVVGVIAALLLARLDSEPNYLYLMNALRHFGYSRRYEKLFSDKELLDIARRGMKEVAFEDIFENGPADEEPEEAEEPETVPETKSERKARLHKEKLEKKAEDKILKSKTATKEEKDAIWLKRANRSAANSKAKREAKSKNAAWYEMDDIMAFTDIKDDLIEYGGSYFGAAIEIPPVEFRFFSTFRRKNSIENGLGAVLRAVNQDYCMNIVKVERPVKYDMYLQNEYDRADALRKSYETGMISEEELQARIEIIYERINDLNSLIGENKVVLPFYYLVLFDSDKRQLENEVHNALDSLRIGEMEPRRLNTKELAVFLKYTNWLDVNESEIDRLSPDQYAQWAMPGRVEVKPRVVQINNLITHNMRVVNYPTVVGDSWIAGVMSMPNTKVVIKCQPMDRGKAIRTLDRSLQELRSKFMSTSVDSQLIELQKHIDTLSDLLATLSGDNEVLLNMNVYITAYDIVATRNDPKIKQPPKTSYTMVNGLKKTVRRVYQESNFRLNNMEFNQTKAFIASQVSAYDPMSKDGRGVPSNTIGACFPWIYSHIADEKGIKLGTADGVPVFIDFFRRDNERVNSNMVIVGKSGSGKSYATKSLLTNLAADDAKIFILDPENEYTELAENLHGKYINVANAQYGRLNPFHIITALDDDEEGNSAGESYASHLQFLEEFFKQIIPDCDKDAMEYLNSLVDRTYAKKGITPDTDLSKLRPSDYPVFDDLYDNILFEFQSTDNEYIRTMLRTLMNYVAKFSTGGRNASIWNGPSTVTTEENFTVFNFQSILANRNGTVANAQMLLVLKYIDNEIIKNRDYNAKYGLNRKIIVVIDEAHVFIDTKFPIALDFMFQLAKRIRKYNGMQIVITQNIKDFVGTEEIARKSTAIINACQYSFIFSLAPNDMGDLCQLYEKAGGINEMEQEQIVQAPRGQAFTIMGPASRSTFKVSVPEDMVDMFENKEFTSNYFYGEEGEKVWDKFVADSRDIHDSVIAERNAVKEAEEESNTKKHVSFLEMSEEELRALEEEDARKREEEERKNAASALSADSFSYRPEPMDMTDFENFEIPDIPDDPDDFMAMLGFENEEPEVLLTDKEDSGAGIGAAAIGAAAIGAAAGALGAGAMGRAAGAFGAGAAGTVNGLAAGALGSGAAGTANGLASDTGNAGSSTEKLLADLLGRFSYETMLNEIKRTVRSEVEAELAGRNIPSGNAGSFGTSGTSDIFGTSGGTASSMQSAEPETEMDEDEDFDLFAELFKEDSGEPLWEEPEQKTAVGKITPVKMEVPAKEEEFDFSSLFSDDSDDDFDIMELLTREAEKMEELSPIDQMLTYGETVIDITLDQLDKYIRQSA